MANKRQRDLTPTAVAAVCLSDLPDDLLCHILSFAPLKEAASTSALARRWRTLWLLSGALNLDSRTRFSNARSTFQRDAKAAMAAHRSSGLPVKKLTFYYHDWGKRDMLRQLHGLLSSPAARHLEELYFGRGHYGAMCSFRINSLPSFKALRVLHITNCIDFHSPGPGDAVVPFPRLTQLRLYLCVVSRQTVLDMIDASPLLNTLQLDQVYLHSYREPRTSLSLPKVTTLLLENFSYVHPTDQRNLLLDAPNLRCFTYKGPVRSLSLKSPAPHMTRVELHFDVSDVHRNNQGKDVACQSFWQIVSNFCSAKMLLLSFEPPHRYAPGR